MRKKFHYQYPKLTLFCFAIVVAYLLFTVPKIEEALSNLGKIKLIGILFAGMLYSFGFTSPFATGIFITLNPDNISVAAMLGGIGALFADLLIFAFIRFSFMDEFEKIKKVSFVQRISGALGRNINEKIQLLLLYILAAIIIASPLPDEFGVTFLAGLTQINKKQFILISFLLNTVGIFTILAIAAY